MTENFTSSESSEAVQWVGEQFPERLLPGDTWNGLAFPTEYAVIIVGDVTRCGYCGRISTRQEMEPGEISGSVADGWAVEHIASWWVKNHPCGHSKQIAEGDPNAPLRLVV